MCVGLGSPAPRRRAGAARRPRQLPRPSAVVNEKMATHMTDEQRAELAKAFPLGRLGQPDDIAAAALFLLSDAASWVTGVTLDVSGGRIIV